MPIVNIVDHRSNKYDVEIDVVLAERAWARQFHQRFVTIQKTQF